MPVGINTLRGYFNNLKIEDIPDGYDGGVVFVSGYNQLDFRRLRGQVSGAYAFKDGDIIVEVEGKDVENMGELNEKLQEIVKTRRVPSAISVMRGGSKIQLKPTSNRRPPVNTGSGTTKKPKRKTQIF